MKTEQRRRVGLALAAAVSALALSACGSSARPEGAGHAAPSPGAAAEARPTSLPGVGSRLAAQVPSSSRQVVVAYGSGRDDADSEVVLYLRKGAYWERTASWAGHNGKRGWTTDHHEGDRRSPVGVYRLSDAGGVLPDPGARLPYTSSASFQAPHSWARSHWHDFDQVIAIDYNRVVGRSPNDPERPEGQSKGGSIWLHMDHGSGTSACVSIPESGMKQLLRTLDPGQRPVIVMGDRADLKA